jgi:hypothetical protein
MLIQNASLCRLHLYHCTTRELRAAVSTLASLTTLRSCSLGVWAYFGSELDCDVCADDRFLDWDEECRIPPLGKLAGLTALSVRGWADPPPDLRQLSGLARLDAWVLLPPVTLLGLRAAVWPDGAHPPFPGRCPAR